MLGLKPRRNNVEVATALRAQGLLTVPAGDNVVRLLPPLTVSEAEIDQAIELIEATCRAAAA